MTSSDNEKRPWAYHLLIKLTVSEPSAYDYAAAAFASDAPVERSAAVNTC